MNVSIHAPARGATSATLRSTVASMVSIHAPARGATIRMDKRNRLAVVSIHAPARGATPFAFYRACTVEKFQSTPPRGGRRSVLLMKPIAASVSIHAPARGATQLRSVLLAWHRVSIHAPARGATPAQMPGTPCVGGFNPRPRAGGDPPGQRQRLRTPAVSIHAPARGATAPHPRRTWPA